MSNRCKEIERKRNFHLLGSDHVWLGYLILDSFMLDDNMQFRFLVSSMFIKTWGVQLICNHGGHANLFNHSISDEEIESSECSTIMKRRRGDSDDDDDDDCNLELSCYPLHMRNYFSVSPPFMLVNFVFD